MIRTGFIGGSDLYSIMRGDWHELWKVKVGMKEADNLDHIFKVQLGSYTEQFNIDWFCRDTGHDASQQQQELKRVISGVPFKGMVDAFVTSEEGAVSILECKHTSSNRSMSDMLETYMPQIQLYMALSHHDQAYLSVIFGNDIEYCAVGYDEDYFTTVVERCQQFWQLVTSKTEPTGEEAEWKIDWSSVKIDGLKSRDANDDNYFMSLAHDYVFTNAQAKQHDIVKKELRSLIADDEREVFCDLLTIKRDKRGACRITVKNEVHHDTK
jgi:hypothetical protein